MSALPTLYDHFIKLIEYLVSISFEKKGMFFFFSVGLELLFSYCKHCILVSLLQLRNKQEDRGQVIILFQDMLEVVTRDIVNEKLSNM